MAGNEVFWMEISLISIKEKTLPKPAVVAGVPNKGVNSLIPTSLQGLLPGCIFALTEEAKIDDMKGRGRVPIIQAKQKLTKEGEKDESNKAI